MENTTQLFLAVRFNCNKCHDHPFERWTQDQYYSLAAYFAQVGRTEDPKYKGQKIGGTPSTEQPPLVEIISDTGKRRGEARPHRRVRQAEVPLSSAQDHADRDGDPPRADWRSGSRRRRTRTSPRAT